METVKQNDISKEQIELNLAINYMVIERVLRCMGIYNTVCDIHEGLDGKDGIFASARDRSLLDKLLNLGKEGVEVYLEEYHKLFGLRYEILLGQEQFQLGIDIKNMNIPEEYKNLLFKKTYLVSAFKELHDLSILNLYSDIDRKELSEKDKALGQRIGAIDIEINGKNDIENNKIANELLNQLQFNPLGINTAGLFIMLFKDGHIKVYTEGKTKREILRPFDMKKPTSISSEQYKKMYFDNIKKQRSYWNNVNKLFENSFSNIHQREWINKTANLNVLVNWKDNIYSLDSIVYSVLRYFHYNGVDILGGELGNKNYQVMDVKEEALPYPLKFVDEISYPITFDEDNYIELYEKSDLLILMCTLMSNEYRVADRKLELITQSSIEKEIKRYKERIKAISTRQDRIDVEIYNAKDTAKITLAEIAYMNKNLYYYNNIGKISEPTVEECKSYVNFLEEQQKLFDTDPKQWAEQYIKVLDGEQKSLDGQIQLLDIEIKINKNEEEKKQSPAYYILCNKREILKNRIVLIEKHKKKLNNKANQKNPAPFVLVKEPYYEEVGLEDYITRGTKDKTNKKKSKKKNKKKNKKTEK